MKIMTDEELKAIEHFRPDRVRAAMEADGLLIPGTDILKDGSGTWYGSMRATCGKGAPLLSQFAPFVVPLRRSDT
jgi:hypothetical protein